MALAVLAAGVFAVLAPQALAVTFTVNSADDTDDAFCDPVGHCSLREAINAANTSAGLDIIDFSIPSTSTISITGTLPNITEQVVVDGTTQAGGLVEIDGGGAVPSYGLAIGASAGSTSLMGLAVGDFAGLGISIAAPNVGFTMGQVLDNASHGIQITGSGVTIGGTTSDEGNRISGNGGDGILVGSGGDGVVISNNLIGVDAAGGSAHGNGGDGINLNTPDNFEITDNTISGNGEAGIQIDNGANFGSVLGNRIGTNAAGTAAIPNALGMDLFSQTGTTIGTAADANVISGNTGAGIRSHGIIGATILGNRIGEGADGSALGNGGPGVEVEGGVDILFNVIRANGSAGVLVRGTGNKVSGNSIYANTALGIDLEPVGVTANDPPANLDADTGSNNLQNFPVYTDADAAGGTITLTGTLDSAANTTYALEFFHSAACDPSGNGEGQTYLGVNSYTTNAAGHAQVDALISSGLTGGFITATATDPSDNTSEFSACVPLQSTGSSFVVEPMTTPAQCATGSTTLGFDDAANDANVAERYAGLGLHFVDGATVSPLAYDGITEERLTQSPPNSVALEGTSSNEPLKMTFDTPQSAVGFYLGNGVGAPLPTATVTAADEFGNASSFSVIVSQNDVVQFYGLRTTSGEAKIVSLAIDYGNTAVTEEIDDVCFVALSGPTTYVVTNTNDSGEGSLRQAIIDANASLGTDTITFDHAAAGVRVINLSTALTTITDPVTIDATTEPVWDGAPIWRVDGADTIEAEGIVLGPGSGGSTIAGLMVTNFDGSGIVVSTDDNVVRGNYVGTDGVADLGNGTWGVHVDGFRNTIGGPSVADRNVIAGNGNSGVRLLLEDDNVVRGNYIGTDATGNAALANGEAGVSIESSAGNEIRNNVISGNAYWGIQVANDGQDGNYIYDNLLGVGADGATQLGNGLHGISLTGSDFTIIGDNGTLPEGVPTGGPNTIAYNGGDGVFVESGGGNRIVANSIHDNTELGIDLATGANGDQGAPEIQSIDFSGESEVNILATFDAPRDGTYRVDYYANAACDTSGSGEGRRHLGHDLTTAVVGPSSIDSTSFGPVSVGDVITATVTGPGVDGNPGVPVNTSEFSTCFVVAAPGFVVTNTNDSGAGSLRQTILNANASLGSDTITFAIPGGGPHVITPASPLPEIAEPVTVDGTTQSGWIGPPAIRIDGAALALGNDGLTITGGGTTIRGLMLTNIPDRAINLLSSGNTIAGNYLGTDGFSALAGQTGLSVRSSNNVIGGTTPLDRNVVTGSSRIVEIQPFCIEGPCGPASGNVVRGNYLGTNASGTATLGDPFVGLYLAGVASTLIGGPGAGAGNVIGGAGFQGAIYVESTSGPTTIQGNLIGVAANGIGRLPNGGPGILIEGSDVLVGGTAPGAGNVIAHNGEESLSTGIVVADGTGSSILGNSIHDNVGLGIFVGVEANGGQPAPVLEELLIGTGITVRGTLDANADTYRLEFFHSPECDPSGFGEGKIFLGAADLPAGPFTVNFPSAPLDGVITATATDSTGNTSEFSGCLEEGIGEVSTAITLTSDEQSAKVGAKLVPLSSVPSNQLPSFAGSPSSTPVGSIPVGSIPVGSIPVGSIPVGSIPVGSIPVGSIPVGSIPVGSIPVGSIGLNAIPVGSIGLDQILLSMLPVDADALLLGTALEDHPRQTITLGDIFANATTRARFEALTLADSGLAQSILAGVPFSAFLLGAATLNQLPPPNAATWCAAIEAAGGSCTGVSGSNTVVGLSIGSIPVGSIPVGSIPVGSIPVGSIPVGSIPVGSIDLEASRLADIPVGSISDPSLVVSCPAETCPTLGDAKRLNAILESAELRHLVGAFPSDLVLNDLIMGIIPRSALAWESFPIDGFQLFDSSGVANTVRYKLRFTVPCPVPSDLSVRVTLPQGWLYKTGTTRWQYGTTATPIEGAEPTTSSKAGARWTSYPGDPCTGGVSLREVELSFQALSGFALGSDETTASVTMAGATQQSTGRAPVLVNQNWEANDAPADAPTIAKDTLVIGHVAAAGDKEIFRMPIPEARGTRTTFYLSHIAEGADFDLVIGKPAAASLQSNPVGSIPVGSIPVEDGGSSVDNSGEALPPETLQDVPVGSIPVGSISANRGSTDEVAQVVADGEQGFYTIVVSGYNGSHSDQPFVLRAVQTPPPTLPPCQPRNLTLGTAGTLPASLPVSTKTLFLVNQQRLAALYPNQSVPDMLAAATSVATSAGVEGAILPIDGSQAVQNAYAAWDTDPCSIDRANDVVAAINAVVAGYRTNLPNLRYVVLLGTDEALPMMRRLDPVTISNETDEAPDLFFTTATAQGTRANALYAAAALGYYLSDGVYGAFTSVPWLGRDLYLPNVAVGRLVEGPLDIQRQLELYVSAGGQLAPTKTLTTAYDFLTDGGQAVAAGLAGVGSANVTMIDDTWTAGDLETAFTAKTPPDDVLSVNAHYSHWLLQPAAGPTLVSTQALPAVQSSVEPAFARRILFTMGCHGGLNVADTLLPSSLNLRFQDWVQGWAQQRAAVYVANTGFGYGDTEANALSERLMSIFAEKLVQGGAIGERWVDAVHEYFATAGVYGVYDEKALTEATFYGLPFWRVGPDPAPPASGGDPTDTGLGFAVAPETVTPSLTENVTPRGRFWDANGDTLAIHYRPIQPRVAVDVTRTGWVATGALVTELRTDDIANVDPVNATPTIDLGANEPERDFEPQIFPASPVALTRSRSFTGDRQHAVVIAGQFRPDQTGTSGTERLVRRIGLEIAYVQNPTDTTPPLIEQVAAVHTASATIFVKASEDAPGGVVRVAALWSDGTLNSDGTLMWNLAQLAQVPGGWSAGPFDTAGQIQVIAMAQNANGLVAYSANKGVNFPSVTDAAGPEILIESPAPGAEYLLNEQVPVSFACSDAGIVTSCTSNPAGNPLDTATVGPKTLTVTATDLAGNTTTLEIPYTVIYRFTGFFDPVSNPPYMNQMKAGKAVPLRFSLSGNQGLGIFTAGYPASRQIVCDTSVPIDTAVPTTTAGTSSLVYHSFSDSYIYIWKTESSWAKTCRRLIFKFADGKERALDFKFVK